MNIIISLEYFTTTGRQLHINIGATADSYPMHQCGDGRWCYEFKHLSGITELRYSFAVTDIYGVTVRTDALPLHNISLPSGVTEMEVYDAWHEPTEAKALLASAFADNIFARKSPRNILSDPAGDYVEFQVEASWIRPNQSIYLCGGFAAAGDWNVDEALPLSDQDFPIWKVRIPRNEIKDRVEYKFIVKDSNGQVMWEPGENRHLYIRRAATTVIAGAVLRNDRPLPKIAGMVIPVFSLRSTNSWGIGDFEDLKLMIDWAAKTGQKIVQILPINDTTISGKWTDSYPYNSISTFALHPIYLRVDKVGSPNDSGYCQRAESKRQQLNNLKQLDYESVFALKMNFLRKLFNDTGEATLSTEEYRQFEKQNHDWLDAYKAFCVLRDINGTADISTWEGFESGSKETIIRVIAQHLSEANFYGFLQYHLHRQLKETVRFAREKGVALKGDIPIGISRNSVDAWCSPQLFNLEMCAGAPPDDFAIDGQNWGFPTYNWDEMAKDGYAWWKARFKKMSEYFDAYRIDHILGFFRIWQIPRNKKSGLFGYFYPALPMSAEEMSDRYDFKFEQSMLEPSDKKHPTDVLFIEDEENTGRYHPRINGYSTSHFDKLNDKDKESYKKLHNDYFYVIHNDYWKKEAMLKLPPLLHSTKMLPCGEDLGMIPACVAPVMKDLGILSLEVQRMPKEFGIAVGDPAKYSYQSVATTSTHDMPVLRQWLISNGETGTANECESIVRQHLESPAIMAILPLQDWLSIDEHLRPENPEEEQINKPECPNHYWRYRMPMTIEQLSNNTTFAKRLKKLIVESGRGDS